jgi:5-methylcytosine-specific restriction endonuclease McrA
LPYKDPEAARACDRRYVELHREFRRASWRQWHKNHRAQSAAAQRRKVRRRKLRLFRRDRWRCVYCQRRGTMKTLTRDHKVPLSRGGPSTLENLVTACRGCNQRKGTMTYWAFVAKLRAELPSEEPPDWLLADNPLALEDEEAENLLAFAR